MFLPALLQATYTSVQGELMPAVMAALLLDGGIVGAWYMLGSILNNNGMKGAARGEFLQFIGTILIAVIIIVFLATFGDTLTSAFNSTQLLGTGTISSMCGNIMRESQLGILGQANVINQFSFLGGTYVTPGQQGSPAVFPGLCSYVDSTGTLDQQINYPLAATGVVVANLTNQTSKLVSDLYVLSQYTNYLYSLTATVNFRIVTRGLFIDATYTPYSGYKAAADSTNDVGWLAMFSLQAFVAQLALTSIFLYIWPFLLFVGLLFRATPFTRKIGGLFIAIALGIVLIYPSVFALEYVANGIGNGTASVVGSAASALIALPQGQATLGQIYGFNSITGNSLLTVDYSNSSTAPTVPSNPAKTYMANFFVIPKVPLIAEHFRCWPDVLGHTSMAGAEILDTASYMVPVVAQLRLLIPLIGGAFSGSAITGSLSHILVPYSCNAQDLTNMAFALYNVYGLTVVAVMLLPLFNIIITLTAIIGLSGLFGGDTDLAGLSKLV